jgi:hypothetical protein
LKAGICRKKYKMAQKFIHKKGKTFGKRVEFAEMNLFVWALLLNRIEIAKIFWQSGEVREGGGSSINILTNSED